MKRCKTNLTNLCVNLSEYGCERFMVFIHTKLVNLNFIVSIWLAFIYHEEKGFSLQICFSIVKVIFLQLSALCEELLFAFADFLEILRQLFQWILGKGHSELDIFIVIFLIFCQRSSPIYSPISGVSIGVWCTTSYAVATELMRPRKLKIDPACCSALVMAIKLSCHPAAAFIIVFIKQLKWLPIRRSSFIPFFMSLNFVVCAIWNVNESECLKGHNVHLS